MSDNISAFPQRKRTAAGKLVAAYRAWAGKNRAVGKLWKIKAI